MNGELFFVFYYGGVLVVLGIFAQIMLNREFKKSKGKNED